MKKNRKVTLRLTRFSPSHKVDDVFSWELSNRTIFITSYIGEGYYTRRSSAKRAAVRTAKMLGLEVVGIEKEL